MRFLSLLIFIVGATCLAEENFGLGEKFNLTPSCRLLISGRTFFLNMCPANTVMVGATPLAGNPNVIQVLCSKVEIRCAE
ncbi:MAG: hypothetical protein SGJ18_02735 [Pseudomonadota bacterium]|nr:hypothetical protein [Pseudomonadota bacterium]